MDILEIISLFDNTTETDVITLTPLPEHDEVTGGEKLLIVNLRKGDTVLQVRGTESQVRKVLYEPLHTYFGEIEMLSLANVPTPSGQLPQ